MSGTSTKTVVHMVRLPVEVSKLVVANAAKRNIGVSEYLRDTLMRRGVISSGRK